MNKHTINQDFKSMLDGKAVNTGIFGVLRRRTPIGAGCGDRGSKNVAKVLLAALLYFPLSICADQFYMSVGFQCNQKKSELTILFKGASNEKGLAMISAHDNNTWNTWDLVSITLDKDEKYMIKEKPLTGECLLKGQQYKINIFPMMSPRFHPEGYCASRMGARVTVYLKNKRLTERGFDGCTEMGVVTESILLRPRKPIVYKEVPAEDFYVDK